MEQPLRVRPAPAPRLAAWAPRRQEIIAAQPRLPVPAVVGDSASRCLSLQVRLFSSCEAGGLVLLQLMGHRAWRRPPRPEAWCRAHPHPTPVCGTLLLRRLTPILSGQRGALSTVRPRSSHPQRTLLPCDF